MKFKDYYELWNEADAADAGDSGDAIAQKVSKSLSFWATLMLALLISVGVVLSVWYSDYVFANFWMLMFPLYFILYVIALGIFLYILIFAWNRAKYSLKWFIAPGIFLSSIVFLVIFFSQPETKHVRFNFDVAKQIVDKCETGEYYDNSNLVSGTWQKCNYTVSNYPDNLNYVLHIDTADCDGYYFIQSGMLGDDNGYLYASEAPVMSFTNRGYPVFRGYNDYYRISEDLGNGWYYVWTT